MSTLQEKIDFIRHQVPEADFHLELNSELNTKQTNYRLHIRERIQSKYISLFNESELNDLTNLTKRPHSKKGFFSISHCSSLGGFVFAKCPVGFDVETTLRVSINVINRTSHIEEQAEAPDAHFLWVAKEAAFKALSYQDASFVMTDFISHSWQSYNETQVHGFRISSKKTLALNLNKGFVFSEKDTLVAVFFA